MATKAVKVKAHKRLSGTGKIEDVNAHVRKIEDKIDRVVYFKVAGHLNTKHGPVLKSDTNKTVADRLSRVFNVPKSGIEILSIE